MRHTINIFIWGINPYLAILDLIIDNATNVLYFIIEEIIEYFQEINESMTFPYD